MSYRLSHLVALFAMTLMLIGCPNPTPPNKPEHLVAAATSSSSINLSWTDASNDEDRFAVERCTGAGCTNFTALGNAPADATSYSDQTVVGATSYSYRVQATSDVGPSAFSNTATAVAMTPVPTMALTPSSLSFTAQAGGSNPVGQSVQVLSSAPLSGLALAIEYQAGQPTGWLTGLLNATKGPLTLALNAATTSLPPGTYNARVWVSSTAINSPRPVDVTFTVTVPPIIALMPNQVTLAAAAGGASPAPQFVQVRNAGGGGTLTGLSGNVTYSPGQPTGWLTAILSTTTAPSQLTLSAATGALAAGVYAATVMVSATGATSMPVPVTLVVSPAPLTAVRFVNSAGYSVNFLVIDGVQHFTAAPQGIPPGSADTITLSPGTHTYELRTGSWEADGSRERMYTYTGTFTQTSGVMGVITISDPTISELLTKFDVSGYWEGPYLDGTGLHRAAFRFFPNGTWVRYEDGIQKESGLYALLSRTPEQYLVTFGANGIEGMLHERVSRFDMRNGPPLYFPVIAYTYRGT